MARVYIRGTARLQIKGITDTRAFIGFFPRHLFLSVLKNRLRDARLTTCIFGLKSVCGMRTFFFGLDKWKRF